MKKRLLVDKPKINDRGQYTFLNDSNDTYELSNGLPINYDKFKIITTHALFIKDHDEAVKLLDMTIEPEKGMKKVNNSFLEIARQDHADIFKRMN